MRLKELFHSSAVMSGYFQGEFYIGSPELFFDEIRDNPLSTEADSAYVTEITSEALFGQIATVVLEEKGYLGLYDLINLFQLTLVDGEWKIVSKSYSD